MKRGRGRLRLRGRIERGRCVNGGVGVVRMYSGEISLGVSYCECMGKVEMSISRSCTCIAFLPRWLARNRKYSSWNNPAWLASTYLHISSMATQNPGAPEPRSPPQRLLFFDIAHSTTHAPFSFHTQSSHPILANTPAPPAPSHPSSTPPKSP